MIQGQTKRRLPGLCTAVLLGIGLLLGYLCLGEPSEPYLFQEVRRLGRMVTGAENLVAAVYLDFRLFDTLLEALLLLVSVIGVSQFAGRSPRENQYESVNLPRMDPASQNPSRLMRRSLSALYPLIGVFGVYVISTGLDGPGGGFQGGAVLAAVFISIHFSQGRLLFQQHTAEMVEKIAYALLLVTATVFLSAQAFAAGMEGAPGHRGTLFVMNLLIGGKVSCGLTVIYLLFMESISKGKEGAAG